MCWTSYWNSYWIELNWIISQFKALAKRSNIVSQTFEICFTGNVWLFGHVTKPSSTSSVCLALLSKASKTFSCLKQEMVGEQCFETWPDGPTFRLERQFQMLDEQCLIVWSRFQSINFVHLMFSVQQLSSLFGRLWDVFLVVRGELARLSTTHRQVVAHLDANICYNKSLKTWSNANNVFKLNFDLRRADYQGVACWLEQSGELTWNA